MFRNPAIRMGIIVRREEEPHYALIRCEQIMRFLALTILGIILITNCAKVGASNKPANAQQDNQWLKEQLLHVTALPPFSFAYDRHGSRALPSPWPRRAE